MTGSKTLQLFNSEDHWVWWFNRYKSSLITLLYHVCKLIWLWWAHHFSWTISFCRPNYFEHQKIMILLCMKFIKLFAFCYWKKFLCKGSHFSTFLFRTKLFYRIILHRHIVMCIWYHVRIWNQIWTLPHKLNVCKFIFHENVWCLDKTVRCTEQYWLWGYHFHGKVLVSCVRRYKRLQCDLQPGQ